MDLTADNVGQKIRFDAEDRLPPAYWDRLRLPQKEPQNESEPVAGTHQPPAKPIDPKEWVKAPEFVPRHQQILADSFGYMNPMAGAAPENNVFNHSYESVRRSSVHPMENSVDSGTAYSSPSTNITPDSSMVGAMGPPIGVIPYNLQPLFRPPLGLPPHSALPTSRPCMPLPRLPSFVPRGYSANIAAINSQFGPPIAAIVLKKKRKRRQRRALQKTSMMNGKPADNTDTYESLSHLTDFHSSEETRSDALGPTRAVKGAKGMRRLRSMSSEPDLTSFASLSSSPPYSSSLHLNHGRLTNADSCPDFSEKQLKLWDDILFHAVMNEKQPAVPAEGKRAQRDLSFPRLNSHNGSPILEQTPEKPDQTGPEAAESPIMRTSIYELCPSSIYEEDGNAEPFDPEEQRRFLEEMSNSRSAVIDPSFQTELMKPSAVVSGPKPEVQRSPQTKSIEDSFNLIKKTSAAMEDLSFKPMHAPKGTGPTYAQYITRFNPQTYGLRNEVYNPDYDLDSAVEEDYFEGMRIRVNAFDDCEELTLSESECPEPSRFQQMQWAIQRQKDRYIQLAPPERVCCSLM